MDYPLAYADQLHHYLRGLRKGHGMTQAALGRRMGLSQARIAEIEANPKLISVEQLLRILSVLHARLVIQDLPEPMNQKKTKTGIPLRQGQW